MIVTRWQVGHLTCLRLLASSAAVPARVALLFLDPDVSPTAAAEVDAAAGGADPLAARGSLGSNTLAFLSKQAGQRLCPQCSVFGSTSSWRHSGHSSGPVAAA